MAVGEVVGVIVNSGVAVLVGEVVGVPITSVSVSAIHHNKSAATTTIIATVIAVLMTSGYRFLL